MSAAEPWSRLRPLAESRGVDALVLSSYQAVSYFAGTHLLSQLYLPDRLTFLVVTEQRAVLLTSDIEASQARGQSAVDEVLEYVEFQQTPAARLAEVLGSAGLATASIGYEARRLPADTYVALREALPGARLLGLDDEIEALQCVKPSVLQEGLAAAARATQRAIDRAVTGMDGDSTEVDLTGQIVADLARSGGTPVFCFVGSGPRALVGHPHGTDERLKSGSIWRVDVGARFDGGLMSDVARTGVVGEPTARQARTFALVRHAQQAGFDAIRPGAKAAEVYDSVRAVFTAAGHNWNLPHVGHGLGIGIHEEPIFAPRTDVVLEPGMVVNVEPALFLPEQGEAYHTEDLAVVVDDGCEVLTEPQRELMMVVRA